MNVRKPVRLRRFEMRLFQLTRELIECSSWPKQPVVVSTSGSMLYLASHPGTYPDKLEIQVCSGASSRTLHRHVVDLSKQTVPRHLNSAEEEVGGRDPLGLTRQGDRETGRQEILMCLVPSGRPRRWRLAAGWESVTGRHGQGGIEMDSEFVVLVMSMFRGGRERAGAEMMDCV